jgi:F0F1-type ATP synthase assembly protein I
MRIGHLALVGIIAEPSGVNAAQPMKVLAVWLLSAVVLGAVFGWLIAIGVGLIIAMCYVGMVRGASSSSGM